MCISDHSSHVSACDVLGCDQFCIDTVNGAQCFCKDGYTLSPDNKTCNGKKNNLLV